MEEFEKIYNSYFNDVYLYIRRLSGNVHIAKEITSDTFFKAMKSIDNFRGECDIRVWLCQIAKNCYYSFVKKNSRIESVDCKVFLEIPDTSESINEELARRDDVAAIKRAISTLGEPYKEVFMWRIFAELSFRQIGQIFNKTENWACVTYHRAKKMIKEKLEADKHEK